MTVEEVTPGEWVHRTPARDLNWNSVYADQLPPIYNYQARQALFRVVSWTMEPIGQMLKRRRPYDPDLMAASATRLQALAKMAPELFEHDTRGFGIPTRALDLIWEDKAGFDRKMRTLLAATDTLAATGLAQDRARALEAAIALGQACSDCHSTYRAQHKVP